MMRSLFIAALTAVIAPAAHATGGTTPPEPTPVETWHADPTTEFDAADVSLEDFRWVARPVVVFADTPADPAYRRQMELLEDRIDALIERDVVLIFDTDPAAKSDIRQKLRPRGFMLTLIGKDGGVKLRKPFPWDVRELSRSIDKMPMRKQEIRDANRGIVD